MDGRRPERGRCTARTWTLAGTPMDAIASTHTASAIRKRRADAGAMKDRKSKLLRDVLTELNRPRFQTKADRDLLALVTNWPFNVREPVFCWLWANRAEVAELRGRLDGPTWEGIATIMREDGVVGHHGLPPNGNSVRRVWGRICQKIEARTRGPRSAP
jgi:hypothetical protein